MNPGDCVQIGRIVTTFGLNGGIKVSTSGDVLESLKEPIYVYIYSFKFPNGYIKVKLGKFWRTGKFFVFLLDGFLKPEDAESLVGLDVYVDKNDIPPDSESFFVYQLIGLCPKSDNILYQEFKVVEVMENPAHPILKFGSDTKKEVLVPYVDRFVKEVNPEKGFIEILDWVYFVDYH